MLYKLIKTFNISKLIKMNINIGQNNIIDDTVDIYSNVKIGNNNKIYNNCIIYSNTIIGDNNIFLYSNKIGEIGVNSEIDISNFDYKHINNFSGLEIGNNNFFHCDNIISSGIYKKTIIQNNNKILSKCYIHHDVFIENNVIMYPESSVCGLCKLLSYSRMGTKSVLQQNRVLGYFSMIAMCNGCSKNVFPFLIIINGKYIKINLKSLKDNKIYDYRIKNIIQPLINNENNILHILNTTNNNKLNTIINYFSKINNNDLINIINNFSSNLVITKL